MAGTDKMTIDDVCRLMECMAKTKVGLLEWGGLKLSLAPEKSPSTAASGIRPALDASQAIKAVSEARIQASRIAEQRLSAAQTRTARARERAAGGITEGTLKAVESIYKEAISRPAPPPVVSQPVVAPDVTIQTEKVDEVDESEVSELSSEVP